MNDITRFFNEEIALRWPDWEPTSPQAEDWENLIRQYRREDALDVIRKHALQREFKSPSLPAVRKLLKNYQTAKPLFMRVLYIENEDTGKFYKTYVESKQEITDEILTDHGLYLAANYRRIYKGNWIARTGETDKSMIERRRLCCSGSEG